MQDLSSHLHPPTKESVESVNSANDVRLQTATQVQKFHTGECQEYSKGDNESSINNSLSTVN